MIENVHDLLRAAPQFHRDVDGRVLSGHLGEEALIYLERHVWRGARTLETGAGYSTIIFALHGASHTAITPSQREIDELREFCLAHGVSLTSVDFLAESSDVALPRLVDDGPLDFVLIDGNHGFPYPMLDWHFTASRLAIGGRLLLDDMHLWPGRTLRDFLSKEPWLSRETDLCLGRTAVFRKTADRPEAAWVRQPYTLKRSDLSLLITQMNAIRLARVNPLRFARDVALRSVRTAIAYGRHLRDPSVPPPFRRRN